VRILIVSDSHSKKCNQKIADLNKCDINIHCGDSQLNFSDEDLKCYQYKVRGNCDFDINYPDNCTFKLGDYDFFVTHGHVQDVGFNTSKIIEDSKTAKFIFHGHTHIVRCEEVDGKIIINPGSASSSRSNYTETYAVLEILENKYILEIKDFYTNKNIISKKGQL